MDELSESHKHIKHEPTALMKAVQAGEIAQCVQLVEEGADLRVRDPMVTSLLGMAAREGHLEVCRYLIEIGMDIHDGGYDGKTPFFLAAMRGHVDVMKLLLEHGAQFFVHDRDDTTPLHLASYYGRLEACKMLVNLGISPEYVPEYALKSYRPPFDGALKNDQIDVISYYVLECGVELKSEHVDMVKTEFREQMRGLMTEQSVRASVGTQGDVECQKPRSRGFGPL